MRVLEHDIVRDAPGSDGEHLQRVQAQSAGVAGAAGREQPGRSPRPKHGNRNTLICAMRYADSRLRTRNGHPARSAGLIRRDCGRTDSARNYLLVGMPPGNPGLSGE